MNTIVYTPPTAEPVHVDEAKDYLRVSGSDDDTLIGSLITAARQYVERIFNRAIVVQTLKARLDEWPDDHVIRLERPPLIEVDSIAYIDTDGDTQTWAATNYDVDKYSEPCRIEEAYGKTFPTVRDQHNVITVTYKAGYGTPVTADADADTLTLSGRTLANGTIVRLQNSGGALPAGLSADTDYYVVGASGSAIQLATTEGGDAIDITDTGSGTTFVGEIPDPIKTAIKLLVAEMYEERRVLAPASMNSMPTVDNLLFAYRVFQ